MPPFRPAIDRFSEKLVLSPPPAGSGVAGDCWLWTAHLNHGGYATLGVAGRPRLAHRWAYEHFVGPVPTDRQLDHLCRVRRCVNPAHLEPVTQRENLMRGESPSALHALKTHCPQGHSYAEHGKRNPRGDRRCSECDREYNRRSRGR